MRYTIQNIKMLFVDILLTETKNQLRNQSQIILRSKVLHHHFYLLNPIPTGHGRNQPIYECHVTTASRNRVKDIQLSVQTQNSGTRLAFWSFCAQSTFPPLWFSLLGGMQTEKQISK